MCSATNVDILWHLLTKILMFLGASVVNEKCSRDVASCMLGVVRKQWVKYTKFRFAAEKKHNCKQI